MSTPATGAAVRLRPATLDDAAAVRALDGLGGSTRRRLEDDLPAADHRALVAVVDGQVVGFGVVLVGAGDAHLVDVAVAPAHRRRGIGSALVARLRRVAVDELGATAITLEVREGNAAALAMYRHLGFGVAGTRPGYYPPRDPQGPPETAVIMWDHNPARWDHNPARWDHNPARWDRDPAGRGPTD